MATGRPISAETRGKVLDAARSLGYVPDPAVSRLAAARNNLLGVFSFPATFPTDVRHSYYPFLVGVEQEAAAQGYDLVLITGSSSGGAGASGAGALNRVRLADGCLFLGRHAPADELRRLVADDFPVVHVGRPDEVEGLAWVGADYVSASREVVTLNNKTTATSAGAGPRTAAPGRSPSSPWCATVTSARSTWADRTCCTGTTAPTSQQGQGERRRPDDHRGRQRLPAPQASRRLLQLPRLRSGERPRGRALLRTDRGVPYMTYEAGERLAGSIAMARG
ncbi:hypothetical protein ACFWR9_21485 [Streptomyces sp. NPDC058534]|uniref:hypothetical protein n=1 Tax=Streptomyces sp. NPDC058534 TaxID=3346541 RepID=UPI00364B9185